MLDFFSSCCAREGSFELPGSNLVDRIDEPQAEGSQWRLKHRSVYLWTEGRQEDREQSCISTQIIRQNAEHKTSHHRYITLQRRHARHLKEPLSWNSECRPIDKSLTPVFEPREIETCRKPDTPVCGAYGQQELTHCDQGKTKRRDTAF
jgi:hypothetical protein